MTRAAKKYTTLQFPQRLSVRPDAVRNGQTFAVEAKVLPMASQHFESAHGFEACAGCHKFAATV
jgi:hypothetical protein